jgi:hypothetical protein
VPRRIRALPCPPRISLCTVQHRLRIDRGSRCGTRIGEVVVVGSPRAGVCGPLGRRSAQHAVRASPLPTRRSSVACASGPSPIPAPPRLCCVGCSAPVPTSVSAASTSSRCPNANWSGCTPVWCGSRRWMRSLYLPVLRPPQSGYAMLPESRSWRVGERFVDREHRSDGAAMDRRRGSDDARGIRSIRPGRAMSV